MKLVARVGKGGVSDRELREDLARRAAARRRDVGEHTAGLRIALLDAVLGDLEQVLAVEGRSGVGGDVRVGDTSVHGPLAHPAA